MKAYLTIEIEIPNYEHVLARARAWEEENRYRYDDDDQGSALLTDYLMSDINTGYAITDRTLVIGENNRESK